MKKGFIAAYSLAAFAVLTAAVVWFCVSIFSEANRGTEEAERAFSWLCRETAQNSYSLGFMSDAYIERTTALCQGASELIALTISSPTETFYAWPASSTAFVAADDGSLQIQRPSLFSKVMDESVDMGANASPAIRVTAALRTLSPSVLFAASRNSFILIFIVLLSSIIVLLASPGQAQAKGGKRKDDSSKEEEFADAADYSESAGANYPKNEKLYDDGYGSLESESEDIESKSERGERDFAQEIELEREQFLEGRLNLELARAAATEQDVSILILRIFGLSPLNEAFCDIAEILASLFKRGDFVFEFGADALACILPGASLDETMQDAERLYSLLCDHLTERGISSRMCIGISTRMTRAVPASTMIREADTAARKAEEEEKLPIVAFRPTPEK